MAKPKYLFTNVPGIPGCTYYITVGGKNRTLICLSSTAKDIILSDLSTGYKYRWDIRHFSYMMRQKRWRDPFLGGDTKVEVEINHKQSADAFKTRDYDKVELESLVDDIDKVEF